MNLPESLSFTDKVVRTRKKKCPMSPVPALSHTLLIPSSYHCRQILKRQQISHDESCVCVCACVRTSVCVKCPGSFQHILIGARIWSEAPRLCLVCLGRSKHTLTHKHRHDCLRHLAFQTPPSSRPLERRCGRRQRRREGSKRRVSLCEIEN